MCFERTHRALSGTQYSILGTCVQANRSVKSSNPSPTSLTFEYHGCDRGYNRLLRNTSNNIILFQTEYTHFEGKNVNLRRVYNLINMGFRFIHDLMSSAASINVT